MKHIKFPHIVIVKAPYLLPMRYKLSELAQELGIPPSTLRDWLSKGAPHERDERGHIWVIGTEFNEFVEKNRKRKASGRKLNSDEAFCMSCQEIIIIQEKQVVPIKGKLVHHRGKCPNCGKRVNRGDRHAKAHA